LDPEFVERNCKNFVLALFGQSSKKFRRRKIFLPEIFDLVLNITQAQILEKEGFLPNFS